MFKDRLKELRSGKGLLQRQLGEILNVSQRTISSWESGEREPDYQMLVEIARYFEVTTDYLLGVSEV